MPRNIIEILARLGSKDWPDGELPGAGACYLIADGLASKSRPEPNAKEGESKNLPWLEFLRTELKHPDFRNLSRGYSFRGPGLHYVFADTYVSLDIETSYSRTKEYVPLGGVYVTYVTFSLAGLIFTQGIASCLDKGLGYDTVKKLILIQPAFGLHPDAITLAEEASSAPQPIADLLKINFSEEKREQKEASIIADLKRIITAKIPVFLLYWRDDKFVNYSEDFKSQLDGVGVEFIGVDITPDGRGPFYDHAKIARDDKVCRELEVLIS